VRMQIGQCQRTLVMKLKRAVFLNELSRDLVHYGSNVAKCRTGAWLRRCVDIEELERGTTRERAYT
jgi:hypothetical protein